MGSARRTSNSSLIDRLAAEPWKFRFFQAVRLLERQHLRRASNRPIKSIPMVGEETDPRQRILRFRAATRLSFPACEIDSVDQEPSEPMSMTITFLGLSGPSSVLPQHYGVTVWRQLRNRNTALRDFLDLFNDRLVAFFYRAWGKYRVPISVERSGGDGQDGATAALRSLIGFGTDHLLGRTEIPEHPMLHYSGLLSHLPRNSTSLEALLSDFFALPIRVKPFDGRWLALPIEQRTRIASGGQSCFARLSLDAVIGEKYWDVQSSFTIEIGPVDYASFSSFMPNGFNLARLTDLTRLYIDPNLSFRVELCLMKREVPRIELDRRCVVEPLLGWNTWLRHEPPLQDARDASYRLDPT